MYVLYGDIHTDSIGLLKCIFIFIETGNINTVLSLRIRRILILLDFEVNYIFNFKYSLTKYNGNNEFVKI